MILWLLNRLLSNMRKILFGITVGWLIIWICITGFVEYKINSIFDELSNDRIKFSYEKIVVGLMPIGSIAVAIDELQIKLNKSGKIYPVGDIDFLLYPLKKRLVVSPQTLISIGGHKFRVDGQMDFVKESEVTKLEPNFTMTSEDGMRNFYLGGEFLLKKSENNKSYYARLIKPVISAKLASGENLAINGSVEFFRDKMPEGSLSVDLKGIDVLLKDDILSTGLVDKIKYAIDKITANKNPPGNDVHFMINFSHDGVNIDGITTKELELK